MTNCQCDPCNCAPACECAAIETGCTCGSNCQCANCDCQSGATCKPAA